MSQTLDSFSTLLTMITETFLLEEPLLLVSQEKLDKATKDHQGSFTKLKKDLDEAQSERLIGGPAKPTTLFSGSALGLVDSSDSRSHLGQAYEDAVDSINRLGQHLNGLRSGISVQYELVKASRDGKLQLKNRQKRPRTNSTMTTNGNGKTTDEEDPEAEDRALLQAAADAFGDLIEDLGPPLNALSVRFPSFKHYVLHADVGRSRRPHVAILSNACGRFSRIPERRATSLTPKTLMTLRSRSNVRYSRSRVRRTMPSSDCIAVAWARPQFLGFRHPLILRQTITPCLWAQTARAFSWYTCELLLLLSWKFNKC